MTATLPGRDQPPRASVLLRTFDSAATVAAVLDSVRAQTLPAEVVVVDSGSTDATLDLLRGRVERVVTMPRGSFTYGGALNLAAAAATTPVLVPLSSHCLLPHERWLEIAVGHVAAGAVAACGQTHDGDGTPLTGPFAADHAYVGARQHWGLSNTAAALDAGVWRRHRFDETLPASEDIEWTWRALADGGHLVVDPRLVVDGGHRRAAGARAYSGRLRREVLALAHLRPLPPYGLRDALLDWGRPRARDPFVTPARPFGRTRLLDVATRWSAGREAAGRDR
ncbi:glycosyltransferase [Kineococcus glutinatus]|uniref:Glycosyltransferase n=1 Tax=Kineococcus glutinatus TaxID=1070872 RepID=A0ABP9IAD5_9ACTN